MPIKRKIIKKTLDIEIKKYQKELDLEIALKGLHDENLSEEKYFEEVADKGINTVITKKHLKELYDKHTK